MYCCITGCSNTSKKKLNKLTGLKFYCFPSNNILMPWSCVKREKWLNAIMKQHAKQPRNWLPAKKTSICSAHFIGNKKSENPLHPSYVPTIFPGSVKMRMQFLRICHKWFITTSRYT